MDNSDRDLTSQDDVESMGPPDTKLWEAAKDSRRRSQGNAQDDCTVLHLDDLPTEILLHICSFLDAVFIKDFLSKVCVLFHRLINDSTFWRIRVARHFKKAKYPAIAVSDNEYDWISACQSIEHEMELWTDTMETMNYYRCPLFSSVDCVHLSPNSHFMFAGGRDHAVYAFNLSNLDKGTVNEENLRDELISTTLLNAHAGWVWSINTDGEWLITGGWDNKVKYWDIYNSGDAVKVYKCGSPVLCTKTMPNTLLLGSYNKSVIHIDPRQEGIVSKKSYHKGAVLQIEADSDYAITASEDKTIAVYDIRADRKYKTIKLENEPFSLSFNHNEIWAGDKKGNINLIDRTDGDFDFIGMFSTNHTRPVTGIKHNPGVIITCSTDETIQMHSPTFEPKLMNELKMNHGGYTKIAYNNDILVAGNSKDAVEIWRPKTHAFVT